MWKPNILAYCVLPNRHVVNRVKEGMNYQTLQGSPPGYGCYGQAKESPGIAFKEALCPWVVQATRAAPKSERLLKCGPLGGVSPPPSSQTTQVLQTRCLA